MSFAIRPHLMKTAMALLSTAVIVAGCGEAVSINEAERDAEDARREVARDADVAAITKCRDDADRAYARDQDAKAAAVDGAPGTQPDHPPPTGKAPTG